MEFFFAVLDDHTGYADADRMAIITTYNNWLRDNGHFIVARGIASPLESTVVDNRDGQDIVVPGPLNELDEPMEGFWLIEAQDSETAIALAKKASLACNRRLEVRPIL
jgi:hypothetical protein